MNVAPALEAITDIWHITAALTRAAGSRAVYLAVLAVVLAQAGGQAQTTDPLRYSTGYLVTGDYAVGSVDLTSGTTGTIPMSGVPDTEHTDILAAFLYWETIAPSWIDPRQIADLTKFRGTPIKAVRVKSISKQLSGNTAACFTASGALTMHMFRADVLRLLPRLLDKDGKPTGKLLVNDADLMSEGLAPHTVTLAEAGTANQTPQSAGASLVVVYRDARLPLRKIVAYDGLYIEEPNATTTQLIRGFYQSDPSNKKAKITHIVGSGANNTSESVTVTTSPGVVVQAANPFPGSSKSSDRSWAAFTLNLDNKLAGTDAAASGTYGETITSKVAHSKKTPYDCLAWAATWFSTTVKDHDHDGLPDRLEEAATPLKDPNNVTLPDIHAIEGNLPAGQSSSQKHILIEVHALQTTADTTYGSANAPYDSSKATPPKWAKAFELSADGTQVVKVTAGPHNHMPTSEVLTLVGETFKKRGIRALIDVGNIAAYHGLGLEYAGSVGNNDEYLVPTVHASGGELDPEKACAAGEQSCHFPDYPGTIGWGFSLEKYLLGLDDLDPTRDTPRFAKNREGLFHSVTYGHWRGRPKSLPCLDSSNSPTLPESDGQCAVADNPAFREVDYNVPTTSSGAAHLPGSRALITLGGWEDFLGKPFVRASTTVHELAHNLGIWHGGAPARLENGPSGLMKIVEPNCKPNYLSVASYLFQVHGLKDASNIEQIALSDEPYATLNEYSLQDMSLVVGEATLPFKTAWFAPPLPVGPNLPEDPFPVATRLCNGLPLNGVEPLARVESETLSPLIDWTRNGLGTGNASGQDINFDNIQNGEGAIPPLTGFDDWANIRLDQVGSGHLMGGAISNGGSDFGGSDFGGSDFGGSDFGGSDFGGSDFGGSDFGGSDFGGSDFGGLDLDGSDFGGSDFGGSDFGGKGFSGDAELTHTLATDLAGGAGSPPRAFKACVIGPIGAETAAEAETRCPGGPTPLHRIRLSWEEPSVGTVFVGTRPDHTGLDGYEIYRYRVNDDNTIAQDSKVAICGTAETPSCGTPAKKMTFDDQEELPNGLRVRYVGNGVFVDNDAIPDNRLPRSAPNDASVTAVNNTPVAVADGFSVNEDPLMPLTGNVLPANPTLIDRDVDSPLFPVLRSGPAPGTFSAFTFNPDGSFSFMPAANFNGIATFTYELVAGGWPAPPAAPTHKMSADSGVETVTIKVIPINDPPSGVAQTVETTEDTTSPLPITLSGSDIETVDPANLTYAVTSGPSNGTLSGTGRNRTYMPNANFNGTDSITFTVTDRGDPDNCATLPSPPPQGCKAPLSSLPATVSITVRPVNDAPVANGQNVSTDEDTALLVTLTATDVETNPANLTATITQPTHGTVTGTWPGYFTYTPAPNYYGADSFKFTVTDGADPDGCLGAPPICSPALESAPATVSITVKPVNDPPVAGNDSRTAIQNTGVDYALEGEGGLTANDSPGPENEFAQNMTVTDVGNAVNGSVELNEDTITFTPASGFKGVATFEYTVCDDGTPNGVLAALCDTATVSVTVQPLIVGNNAAFGGGPIVTLNLTTGATRLFVPEGAAPVNANGRGVAVLGNEVYYTELANGLGPTDKIRVAPFNGGAGGLDTRSIPNPRPGTGIQNLAFFAGKLYVLTGYPSAPLQMFVLDPATGGVLSGPVNIADPADPDADGFTVLPNGNFLINNFDASCTYNQYVPATGALIPGTTYILPGGMQCTGVDTDGVSLFFQRDFNTIVQTNMAGTVTASWPVVAPSPGCAPMGTRTNCIEDISVVK